MKTNSIFLIIFSVLLLGCKDKKGSWLIDPTNIILLQPNIGNKYLPDSLSKKIKVFIVNSKGEKVYDPDSDNSNNFDLDDSTFVFNASERYDSKLMDKGILLIVASYLNFDKSLGPDHGIAKCYLEFPDGSIDTLAVEAARVDDEEGVKDRCHCSFPIYNVWVNGQLCNISEEYQTQHGVFYYNRN